MTTTDYGRERTRCPICDCHSSYALTKDGCAYLRCKECEFLFHRGLGTDRETAGRAYDGQYWDMERSEALRREREDSFVRALELIYLSTIPVNNILDVGCGVGVTVALLRQSLGLNAVGVDPFGEFTASSFLHKCTLKELQDRYPQGYFDAIYSIEVFEHLEKPKQTMAELQYFMKPGAKLLVNTGTQEFLAKYDPENNYIDPLGRGHISIFSLKSFEALVRPFGLRARFLADRKYMVLLEPPLHKDASAMDENLALLRRLGDWVPSLFKEYVRLILLEKEFEERSLWASALDKELRALKGRTFKR